MSITVESLARAFALAFAGLPLFGLQAMAVVGMIAVTLVATRWAGRPIVHRHVYLGMALGGVACLISWFVADFMKGTIKSNMVLDTLLLGGLLGGLPGGLACYLLNLLARYHFSGLHNLTAAAVDTAVIVGTGMGLRHFLLHRLVAALSWRDVVLVWLARCVATYVGLAAGGYTVNISLADVQQLAVMRTAVFPLSLFILGAALLLLYLDAQTDVQQAREYRLAYFDPQTGLPNRKALRRFLDATWQPNPARKGCLVVLELANLRDFLSRYGPDQGGHLWVHLLQDNFQASLAPVQVFQPEVFHFSDFSLALVLDGAELASLEEHRLVEDVVQQLVVATTAHWPGFLPEFRCGVVDLQVTSWGGDPAAPYRNMTLALNSLDRGVAYFNHLIREDTALDQTIETALDRWLREEVAPMKFQPKVRCRDHVLVGAEALLRMSDSEGRPIPPMRAISVFRKRGRLSDFEWATLLSVLRTMREHREALHALSFAVNLSSETLNRPGLATQVVQLMQQGGLQGHQLKIELVEWCEHVQLPEVQNNIRGLAAFGVTLSLDDFGVGYSSLMMLTQFAFGEVKLDHALISTIANPRTQTLVKLAVDAAQRCHATVVAEGIETQAEEAMVRQLGVHVGQGYFYAHPLGIDELLAFKLPAPQVPGAALSPTGGRPGGDQSASLTPVPLASM